MALNFTVLDLARLHALVDGLNSGASTPGVRQPDGSGNHLADPEWGARDTNFRRIAPPFYGPEWFDPASATPLIPVNRSLNPLFEGLDPRVISQRVGAQAADVAKQADGASMFLTAFSQFVEHGYSMLAKGGHGTVEIGPPGMDPTPGVDNPMDLERATVASFDATGVPGYRNQVPAFADLDQVYGSNAAIATFLRAPDDTGGVTANLLMGAWDPVAAGFRLLPTLRESILAHWNNNTVFQLDSGPTAFRAACPGLVDGNGVIDTALAAALCADFLGTGQALLTLINPGVALIDHFVAGDPRVNENLGLMAMHTLWARNHNHHVQNLLDYGFTADARDLYEASRILNEAEFQHAVFRELADALLGGLHGDGIDGRAGYQAATDPGISLEFAAAASRIGHTLFVQQVAVVDATGQTIELPLYAAFLNPGGGGAAQPGYAELGAGGILKGFLAQGTEELDAHVVDGARTDLVHTGMDLYAIDLARGRDLGVGSLNQTRRALAASTDPYVVEAVDRVGDLTPYSSWEDFKLRNDLSDALIADFQAAYPDLVLSDAAAIAEFVAVNPDIPLQNGNTVRGIDRVDLIVGGLAEAHLDKAMVGETFWVILHEQFDRLQEGDRFHYLDRLIGTGLLGQLRSGPEAGLAAILARNTGLEITASPLFLATGGAGGGGNALDILAPVVTTFLPAEGAENVSRTAVLVLTFSENVVRGTGTLELRRVSDNQLIESFDAASSPRLQLAGNVLTIDPTASLAGGTRYELRLGGGVVRDGAGNPLAPVAGHTFRTEYVFAGTNRGDALSGTAHADTLLGLAGHDFLEGRAGDDVLDGGTGSDFMRGGTGNDTYRVNISNDRVAEQKDEGFDTVETALPVYRLREHVEGLRYIGTGDFRGIGNTADNRIVGGAGNDTLEGGAGRDTLRGEGGADLLFGGEGRDVLAGGAGGDILEGGIGRDIFLFDVDPGSNAPDTVHGVVAAEDRFHLAQSFFPGLGPKGTLAPGRFASGEPTSSNAQIIFNPVASEISYDPDGNGGSLSVVFAVVEGLTGTLAASTFVII